MLRRAGLVRLADRPRVVYTAMKPLGTHALRSARHCRAFRQPGGAIFIVPIIVNRYWACKLRFGSIVISVFLDIITCGIALVVQESVRARAQICPIIFMFCCPLLDF